MALRAPEGTRDFLPDEQRFWTEFKRTAATIFGRYGYQPIETPLFEQTDLFVRGIGEATDVVSKEMFTAISGENLRTLLDARACVPRAPPASCAPWCSMTWSRRAPRPPS